MVGNSFHLASSHPSMSFLPVITPISASGSQSSLPHLSYRLIKKQTQVRASSANAGQSRLSHSSFKEKNSFAVILGLPRSIWEQTLHPLNDFGFGEKSIREGGIGLFIFSGAVLFALSLVWFKGFQSRSRMRKYQAVVEFSQACGISKGTPVRIRGMSVGNVIRISLSLRCIEAVIEIEDDKIIVPKNSRIEVNQSGLLMEPMIDITPQDPLPAPSVGPRDPECVKEGLILCDRQTIRGHQGISLDALVGLCTRLGLDFEQIGVAKSFDLAERVAVFIEEAKPLLTKIQAMAGDLEPLLAEVCDRSLLNVVESSTKNLTEATADLRKMHSSIMTPENTERIRKSTQNLLFTLKNIENISSEISGFTADEATKRNLKLLIKSLSRLF